MAAFKDVKLALLNDAQYGKAPFADPFLQQQYLLWTATIQKAKGWEDLKWRVENIPLPEMVKFKVYDAQRWANAVEQHCTPAEDPTTPEGHLFQMKKMFDNLRVAYNNAQPQSEKRSELRAELRELADDIFDLEFPDD